MRRTRMALVVLILRRPLLTGTIATVLVVGIAVAAATPWLEWRGGATSAAEAAFPSDGVSARDEVPVPPRPIADFALTDQEGRQVRLREQAGKVLLVNFMTTRCTTLCVQVTRELRGLQQALGHRMGRDVEFFSVGLDPRSDTPAALRKFARRHGVDLGSWAFLSGSAEEVTAARRAFGALAVEVPRGQGGHGSDLEHTTVTYLVDRQGILQKKISPGLLTLVGLREIEAVLAEGS